MPRLLLLLAAAGTVGRTASALDNGESVKPTMGFNTWEMWGCDISEQKVKAAADAMVQKGLAAAGYTYLNLGAPPACAALNLPQHAAGLSCRRVQTTVGWRRSGRRCLSSSTRPSA